MQEIAIKDFETICDEILVPRLERVLQRHLREVQALIEVSARGLNSLHDRIDELERTLMRPAE